MRSIDFNWLRYAINSILWNILKISSWNFLKFYEVIQFDTLQKKCSTVSLSYIYARRCCLQEFEKTLVIIVCNSYGHQNCIWSFFLRSDEQTTKYKNKLYSELSRWFIADESFWLETLNFLFEKIKMIWYI